MDLIKVPLKNKKPCKPLSGSMGYRCPVCLGSGMKVKASCLYGGTGCGFCECTGRIKNKNIWIYLKAQQVVNRYEKKCGKRFQFYKILE